MDGEVQENTSQFNHKVEASYAVTLRATGIPRIDPVPAVSKFREWEHFFYLTFSKKKEPCKYNFNG